MEMTGLIDIHVHAAPSIFPRSVTDHQLAQEVQSVGMRGFVLKAHEESTMSRIKLLQADFPDLALFGSLVLNWFVGGLNPYAVDLALQLGAKIIWMPTGSSRQHIQYYGGSGYTEQRSTTSLLQQEGISIFDAMGRIRSELYDILDMVASSNAVAASGHLSPDETMAFVIAAKERHVEKILVTHPDLRLNQIPLSVQVDLAKQGAYLEKSYLTLLPPWKSIELPEMVASIRTIGTGRIVLQTDLGQAGHPTPAQGYKNFIQFLLNGGVSEPEIFRMGAQNPADLLNIAPPLQE